MSERLSGSLAAALATTFSGVAAYILVAEHPASLLLDDRSLLLEWQSAYPAGMRMQASLATLSGLAGMWACWLTRDWRWFLGAILLLANWPYTLIAMQPTNVVLQTLPLEHAGDRARSLIELWGRLHGVRAGLGFLAAALYMWALVRPSRRADAPARAAPV